MLVTYRLVTTLDMGELLFDVLILLVIKRYYIVLLITLALILGVLGPSDVVINFINISGKNIAKLRVLELVETKLKEYYLS